MKPLFLSAAISPLLLLAVPDLQAGSATWSANPATGDWHTAANWMPNTVPNGPADVATFDLSTMIDVSLSASTVLDSAIFNPGADAFSISVYPPNILTFSGIGVANNSGRVESFLTTIDAAGGIATISFIGNASAGDSTYFANGRSSGGLQSFGVIEFHDDSAAGNGLFENGGIGLAGGVTLFFDFSNANTGTFICYGDSQSGAADSYIIFNHSSSAAEGTFMIHGPTVLGGSPSFINFEGESTADHATITLEGGSLSGEGGGEANFMDASRAGDSVLIINGAATNGATGGDLDVFGRAKLENATIIINGGQGAGGDCLIGDDADGGRARVQIWGNGNLTISSSHFRTPVALGSIEGEGTILLGAQLEVGTNNLSTLYAGAMNTFGPLVKVGTGTLTLTGESTYRAGTKLRAGRLLINNSTGSATGTGQVQVEAGTLAGGGIIAGATTVGTGSGAGAFLAPGQGASRPTTLTLQSSVAFKADGTLVCRFNTAKRRADQVVANGVTIENGAQFEFKALGNRRLRPGKSAVLISNTSANPINGTFANLADGSTLSAGPNEFQVSYAGGDGNDLALTVLP